MALVNVCLFSGKENILACSNSCLFIILYIFVVLYILLHRKRIVSNWIILKTINLKLPRGYFLIISRIISKSPENYFTIILKIKVS